MHPDWAVLAAHLIDAYPDVAPAVIASEVSFARRAVLTVKLADDEMLVGELIAHYRILVRLGQLPDAARLDPQVHAPRMTTGVDREADVA